MASDPFRSLTVGLQFDKKRHGEEIKTFETKPKKVAHQPDGGVVQTIIHAAPTTMATFHVPPPPTSLALFAPKPAPQSIDDSEKAGSSEVSAVNNNKHKPLEALSHVRIKHLWKKHHLKVTGSDIPSPIEHFSALVRPPLSVPEHVVSNLFTREHRVPTPIQMQAIPALISKRDVVACAPTGSGKTLAYLIPMFALLREPNPEAGIRALIVAPTMELAVQIEREAFFLLKGRRWKLVQHGQSTKGKDIFVTTPGRVASMVKDGLVDLSHVEYLVFDEGDKLWDDHTDFLPIVDNIMAACSNPNKVVALFTATLSEKIESNAASVMASDPVHIIVRGRTAANTNVEQRLMFCTNELGKVIAVRNFIREGIKPPVLIFVQSIERTKELFEEIQCQGLRVALINSKMTSEERDDVVMNFRLGKIWVLITTELLARGIDFKNIGTVINFDIPLTGESYVHRVGRTGRAGKHGLAVTFFTTDDYLRVPAIARIVKDAGYPVEDWMLTIKVTKKRERSLSQTTPRRMIVSTEKRMLVNQQRVDRQLRAAEKEKAKEKRGRRQSREEEADDDHDDDDE